jgi:hypothetical protein
VPARSASSSWLQRRAVRQRRSSWANRLASITATMLQSYPTSRCLAIPSAVLPSDGGIPTIAGMRDHNDTDNGVTDLPDTADDAVAVVNPKSLVKRYVALWNEADPEVRHTIIRQLWAPTPTASATRPRAGFEAPTLEVRGYAAIQTRAARAYQEFVRVRWRASGSRCSCWTTRAASRSTTSSSRVDRQ